MLGGLHASASRMSQQGETTCLPAYHACQSDGNLQYHKLQCYPDSYRVPTRLQAFKTMRSGTGGLSSIGVKGMQSMATALQKYHPCRGLLRAIHSKQSSRAGSAEPRQLLAHLPKSLLELSPQLQPYIRRLTSACLLASCPQF